MKPLALLLALLIVAPSFAADVQYKVVPDGEVYRILWSTGSNVWKLSDETYPDELGAKIGISKTKQAIQIIDAIGNAFASAWSNAAKAANVPAIIHTNLPPGWKIVKRGEEYGARHPNGYILYEDWQGQPHTNAQQAIDHAWSQYDYAHKDDAKPQWEELK